MVVTIDGPSGVGKTTLARELAKKLNIKYLNTGLIYRSLTYYIISNNYYPESCEEIRKLLNEKEIEIKFIKDQQKVLIDNVDYSIYGNDPIVIKNVSAVAKNRYVRSRANDVQRNFAKNNSVVIEGRDIGSVVFPDAKYKFFIECDINVRAKRRYDDLLKEGINISLIEVKESLKNRDSQDSTREVDPLIKPKDAIIIDTSNKNLEESVNLMLSIIKGE